MKFRLNLGNHKGLPLQIIMLRRGNSFMVALIVILVSTIFEIAAPSNLGETLLPISNFSVASYRDFISSKRRVLPHNFNRELIDINSGVLS